MISVKNGMCEFTVLSDPLQPKSFLSPFFVTLSPFSFPSIMSFLNDSIQESTNQTMFSIRWVFYVEQTINMSNLPKTESKQDSVSTIIFVLSDGNISEQEMLNYFMNANAQEMTKEFLHNFQETSFYSPHYCVYCMGFVSSIYNICCKWKVKFFRIVN